MKVTVLDTETGERRTSTGMRTSEWEYGNWSCDCNRALLFGEGVMHELFAKESKKANRVGATKLHQALRRREA